MGHSFQASFKCAYSVLLELKRAPLFFHSSAFKRSLSGHLLLRIGINGQGGAIQLRAYNRHHKPIARFQHRVRLHLVFYAIFLYDYQWYVR